MVAPPDESRPVLVGAAGVWAGTLVASVAGSAGLVGLGILALVGLIVRVRRVWLVCLVAAVAGAAATVADAPTAGFPPGPVSTTLTVVSDPTALRYGFALVATTAEGVPVRVVSSSRADVEPGDRLAVEGTLDPTPARVGRHATWATIRAARLRRVGGPRDPLTVAGNELRRRVLDGIDPTRSSGRALLAGLVVGVTDHLTPLQLDELRRAGLSHLVAVSGSNVALFLIAWWVVLAPLVTRPLRRAVVGVVGLAIFVVATRWEPSVIRASVMAGVLLAGRALGMSLSPWTALGGTVAGALILGPDLARSIGFQLSVAATAGILLAGRGATTIGSLVRSTTAAQVAVAPLILVSFGSMPLLAPIANVMAIPLVSVAAAAGGVGALLGLRFVVDIGDVIAHLILAVGRVAAPWPQVGWVGLAGIVSLLAVYLRHPAARPVVLVVACLVGTLAVMPSSRGTARPSVVFLDVGQGDAALVLGWEATVLIDGGPDPARLSRALAEHGVDRIDVLLVSHVHADHIEGLAAVFGRLPVGTLWTSFGPHATEASEWLLRRADELGVPMTTPPVGTEPVVGDIRFEILGPRRRYAHPNDQSIVAVVEVDGLRVFFPGDVETVAQSELTVPGIDILKVPHQGAATSDLDWLADHAGWLAVVSVGPNSFGHPADGVIDTLSATGAAVLRTDVSGDIVVETDGDVTVERRRPGP